jgi:hypothetical protein
MTVQWNSLIAENASYFLNSSGRELHNLLNEQKGVD